jgi:TonB family protein
VSALLSLVSRDLAAYSLQLACVVATGLGLAGALRLRAPRVQLAVGQALLLLAVALPWLQPWAAGRAGAARVHVEAVAADTAPRAGFDAATAVALAVVAGIALRLAHLVRRVWRLRRCRRLARPIEPNSAIRSAWQRVGVRAPVCVSAEAGVPAAFGTLHPVVLVPQGFTELSEPAQEAVLCHELLHVRRRDWLQMLAEEVVGAALWFHPAAWWLLAHIRLAREQVVDEAAVGLTRARRVYLDTLVSLACASSPSAAPAPLFLTESHLKRRVDVLLGEVKMSARQVRAGLVVSAAGVALAVVGAARAFPLTSAAWLLPEDGFLDGGAAGGGAVGTSGGEAAARKPGPRKRTVKVDPTYPPEAKSKGVQGSVVLDVLITAAGDVKDVKVKEGPAELTQSAQDAVRQWKFEPAGKDTRATLAVRYSLD